MRAQMCMATLECLTILVCFQIRVAYGAVRAFEGPESESSGVKDYIKES